MSQRRKILDRMRTSFECTESWQGMQGGDSCRFCSQCRREVFDFAQMSPREVDARLEASRGKLCARLTREGGRLQMRMVAEPARPARRRAAGRSPQKAPFAATLLGAFLGVGAAAALPSAAAPAPALVLAAGAPADRAQAEREAAAGPQNAVLAGRLADREGGGIPGAEVTLKRVANGRRRTTVTGEDGVYVFERLPAGLYDLEANLEAFTVDPWWNLVVEPGRTRQADLTAEPEAVSTTIGILTVPELSLREIFDASDVAVLGVVESAEVAVEGDLAEVATRLRVERRFKGELVAAVVTYRHSESATALDPASPESALGLRPGEELLAFLTLALERDARGRSIYEAVDYGNGIRRLAPGERSAYLASLDGLAQLEDADAADPAAMMEWLVATAEDPHTRAQAVTELEDALDELEGLASREHRDAAALAQDLRRDLEEAGGDGGDGGRAVYLAATFTEQQRQRLTEALLATDRLDAADQTLFRLVRGWHEAAAHGWLVKVLSGSPEIADPQSVYYWLVDLAEDFDPAIDPAKVEAFTAAAEERWDDLPDADEDISPEAAEKARLALVRTLLRELAGLLAGGG